MTNIAISKTLTVTHLTNRPVGTLQQRQTIGLGTKICDSKPTSEPDTLLIVTNTQLIHGFVVLLLS